jgi:hypothetical protein
LQAGDAAFQTVAHKAELLEIYVIGSQQPDFGCPEAMPIGDEEHRPVSLVSNHCEQSFDLIKGEKLDRL